LYLEDGVSYKITLKDSNAATVWTQDDVRTPIALPYLQTADETTAGVTPTDVAYPPLNILRYGAVGDNSTECSTAINNAILVAAVSGGTVFFPAGQYKITSTINMKAKVSLLGEGGQASIIEATSIDAITFDFYTSFGKVVIDNLGINGTTTTTNTAITQTGSLDDADELYGITITRCLITNYNTGIHFRQTRVVTIQNNWIQHVNNGIDLVGKNLVYNIVGNEMVYGDGSGTGDKIGIKLDSFNFTDGAGIIKPEGVQIVRNQIFGFETCFNNIFSVFVNFTHNDISALIYGIEWTTANSQFNIAYNYIALNAAGGLAGIIGHGMAAVIEAKTVIENNQFVATVTTGAIGVIINDSGTTNQDHVDIVRNLFSGFDTNDIRVYSGGYVNVENNRCFSSDPTNSIDFIQVGVVRGPCYISKNKCLGDIVYVEADVAARKLIIDLNHVNDTTILGPIEVQNSESVTTTNVITASESGKTFYLNAAGGFTSTLPAPALGLKYKFIVKAAPTTAYIITTNGGDNVLQGTYLDIVGELVSIAAQDTLNFVANTALVGDSLEVESDGTSWFCTAFSKADGGITVSAT
jgi:hypothetical protein